MERNTTLVNFEGLKEFIIKNKVKSLQKNRRRNKENNACLQEYCDTR